MSTAIQLQLGSRGPRSAVKTVAKVSKTNVNAKVAKVHHVQKGPSSKT